MCTTCQEDLTWQEYELQQTTCAHCQEPDDGLESPPPQPLPLLADIVDPADADAEDESSAGLMSDQSTSISNAAQARGIS